MHDVVHVDEKWFYEDVDKRCYYTVGDEEPLHSPPSEQTLYSEDDVSCSSGQTKGALVLKNIESIDKNVYKHYIIDKVIPAIKAAWPSGEKWKVIFIQQDNAKPHLAPTDPDVVAAGTSDGWNIRMLCQPPNSPDSTCWTWGSSPRSSQCSFAKGHTASICL
ncbi:unnamed protein product [Phytophthora lilii]|uniref:Unnamed protein product n=1 Tax=Phytophthora lilii TaxID=2077276 RepID=A0A9W6WW29_9STRA|nr:unnamed protein product [Phytophthora lilii]